MMNRPVLHPGEVLLEEFMIPSGIGSAELARKLDVPLHLVEGVVHRRAAVSATLAVRLARYFGTSERFWLDLQVGYDLERALLAEDARRRAGGHEAAA